MQDAKEEVRARLAIEDVIGEYVELKRAGRNFKGLSPFNDERTPSFVVSPDKHIWHDFSSGKGGDVFSFVMAMDGIDFKEALEKLARKAGVDLFVIFVLAMRHRGVMAWCNCCVAVALASRSWCKLGWSTNMAVIYSATG